MTILHRLFQTLPIFAQAPVFNSTIDWGKVGEVTIIALALLTLTRAFMSFIKNTGEKDKRDDGILKQMIDLATSYKTESAEARDAYKAEAASTRAVVQESNDTLRALTEATNMQTGEIRKLPAAIEKLGFEFKERQSVYADEIEGFKEIIEKLRGEMVVFKTEIKIDIENMLNSEGATHDRVELALRNHKLMFQKLDSIIALFPPPPDKVLALDDSKRETNEALKPTG